MGVVMTSDDLSEIITDLKFASVDVLLEPLNIFVLRLDEMNRFAKAIALRERDCIARECEVFADLCEDGTARDCVAVIRRGGSYDFG
jgi:hypothetical protein